MSVALRPGTCDESGCGQLVAQTRRSGFAATSALASCAYASNACATHLVEYRLRCFVIDDRYAASAGTELPDCIKCASIVGAVHAGLNDNNPARVRRSMQGADLVN